MSNSQTRCIDADRLQEYALAASAPGDGEAASIAAHLGQCARCRSEYEALASTVNAFVDWPSGELPPPSLWKRVATRVTQEGWAAGEEEAPLPPEWPELEWEQPAPGIHCKILSTDAERRRVSMLVRLDPGVEYPPHTHAGLEELHLLDGELWIDDRKLYPGEYNRAPPGTSDQRVWSETGCTCVLITSPDDPLHIGEVAR